MCGINGFNHEDKGLIDKMVVRTNHRGPDDAGSLVTSGWSLGNNRLAIMDLSQNGHQPMQTADGHFAIVYNGEIYNFQEIRIELERLGYRFKSKTDTEVILYSYVEWQEKCLQKFNGMFAFAILDTRNGELFVARDRIGIKPLFYYSKAGKFIFSSEVKAILDHSMSSPLDIDSLNSFFRVLYVPAPKTVWQDISKLPPGHYLKVSAQGLVQLSRYWQIPEQSLIEDKNFILSETKRLLTDSVRLQLISDRPVGVFLSGGIDSTIVTGLASSLSKKVQTFSIGYEETEEADKYNGDKILAQKTAEHFGTIHHEYTLSAKDVLDNLLISAYHMDEPISNHVQTVNMLLAKKVAKEATVVLGGDGGDELFGGYERYYYSALIDRLQSIPGWLRGSSPAEFVFKTLGRQNAYELLQSSPGVLRYLGFFAKKESEVNSFLKPEFNRPDFIRDYFKSLYFDKVDPDFTRQFMRTDIYSWLPSESLARSDKMSMAASIEQRVPFLDHRLVEFADRIPTRYKLGQKGAGLLNIGKNYRGKVILREAMAEFLPAHVLGVQKWGWFSPMAKWIRGPILPLMKEVLSPGYNQVTADMFDFQALNTMLEKHISKEKYALNELWAVATFQLWFRTFMSKK